MKTLFDKPAEPMTAQDKAFDEWVHTPHGGDIANRFIRAAWTLRQRGYESYGGKAIIEGIRWEHALEHGPDEDGLKINNNHVSRLVRFAENREPKLKDFFEKRLLADERTQAHHEAN